MSVYIDLPVGEYVDCWVLVRSIARAVVPDLNPNAVGVDCVIAKQPAPSMIPLAVPNADGQSVEIPFVEEPLTRKDRRYLQQVLPSLSDLRIPVPDDSAEAFLKAYRALPDRPRWEPILLTTERCLQEYARILAARWPVDDQHMEMLQHWLDTKRLLAFTEAHVPVVKVGFGAMIPREDVKAYLDSCGISYVDKEPEEVPSSVDDRVGSTVLPETPEPVTTLAHAELGASSRPVVSASRDTSPSVAGPDSTSHVVAVPMTLPAGPLLSIKEVASRTDISVSMLHEKMNPKSRYYDPDFPQKILLGERTVRYSQLAIDTWIQAQIKRAGS